MNCTIAIRRCTLSDLELLETMEHEVFGDHGYPRPVIRQFYDVFGKWIHIASLHNNTAGYILGAPAADSNCVWVLSLLVLPAYRCQGVARKLLNSIETMSLSQGIPTIRLTVDPSNTLGKSLYLKTGYREHSYESDYFGPCQDRIIMVKTIE